jgi:hypothetical protein
MVTSVLSKSCKALYTGVPLCSLAGMLSVLVKMDNFSIRIVQFRQIISQDVCFLGQLNHIASKRRKKLYNETESRWKKFALINTGYFKKIYLR